MLCKLVPGYGAQGHSDLILSPALGASALSPSLTYGEALTGVLESMGTRPESVQSVCSILPGYRDGLRIWAVTNQGQGLGLRQQSRGRGALVLLGGSGLLRSVYSSGRSMSSAWGNW